MYYFFHHVFINSQQQLVFLGHSATIHSQLLQLNAFVCVSGNQRVL